MTRRRSPIRDGDTAYSQVAASKRGTETRRPSRAEGAMRPSRPRCATHASSTAPRWAATPSRRCLSRSSWDSSRRPTQELSAQVRATRADGDVPQQCAENEAHRAARSLRPPRRQLSRCHVGDLLQRRQSHRTTQAEQKGAQQAPRRSAAARRGRAHTPRRAKARRPCLPTATAADRRACLLPAQTKKKPSPRSRGRPGSLCGKDGTRLRPRYRAGWKVGHVPRRVTSRPSRVTQTLRRHTRNFG